MFKTIVLAVDGSASSQAAIDVATALAKLAGSAVIAVHVVEHTSGGRGGAGPVHADEQDLQATVRDQIERLAGDGIDATLRIEDVILGGPAAAIAETAREVAADVIVTGTRGHSPIAGLVLGSVAQRLLHLASCPVLVVPS